MACTLLICLAACPAPAADDNGNAACLKCHEPIRAALKRKVVHPAVEMGCTTCHADHQAAAAKPQAPHYLTSAPPDLCATCHDTSDKQLAAAHRGQPFAKADCAGCHNPHGSDSPKLLNAGVHPPFAALQCEKCHQSPKDGKVQLVAASVNGLCEGCHKDFKARYDASKVKHALIEMDENSCLNCHRPHASEAPRLLKAGVKQLCSTCHDTLAGAQFTHKPASTNCVICHEPHSSNFPARLKAEVNTLCLGCHGLRPPALDGNGEPLVLPAGLRAQAPRLLLDAAGKGHPYMQHPVSGPNRLMPDKGDLTCLSCHSPHGISQGKHLLAMAGNSLCLSCHGGKDRGKTK